jgi:hypothetical protein
MMLNSIDGFGVWRRQRHLCYFSSFPPLNWTTSGIALKNEAAAECTARLTLIFQ